jgi:hypothetical protein
MAQIYSKIERAANNLTEQGLDLIRAGRRLREMLADGQIDIHELTELPFIAATVEETGAGVRVEALLVEDVSCDLDAVVQTIKHGRHYESKHIRRRRADIRHTLEAHREAPYADEAYRAEGREQAA